MGYGKIKNGPAFSLDGGVDEYHDIEALDNNKLQGNGETVNIFIDAGKLRKRPGKKLWGQEFENAFNGVHEYIDDTGTARLLVANNGSILNVSTTANTAIDTGLTIEDIHFQTHRKRCWYNGATTQRKITNATASRVGIEAPTTKPTATLTTGALTGSYAWKYTFVIKESGVKIWESDLSPISDTLNPSGQGATITPAVSTDSRVNARYIYRTTASGATFQYEGEIDNNTAAQTFTSGTVTDALLGDLAETNHGVPQQGTISEGCNERLFWIVAGRLYYSEMAQTEAYNEYQLSTNFKELKSGGDGTGLKRLYNINNAREDLYVFTDNSTLLLPNGDPQQPLITISDKYGCKQHDTIKSRDGAIYFLSNKNSVCMISGNRIIDISTRGPVKSMAALLQQENCRAEIIFNYYYAITARSSKGKLYNNITWVCDLRKIKEVEAGIANNCWFPWEINAEYLLQRADGTVLMFSNDDLRIYQLSLDKIEDDQSDGTRVKIQSQFLTKAFGGDLDQRNCARQIFIYGKQERGISVQVKAGDYYETKSDSSAAAGAEGGSVFIIGQSTLGSPTTQTPIKMAAGLPANIQGQWFAFKFTKIETDHYFEIVKIQFTFNSFTGAL